VISVPSIIRDACRGSRQLALLGALLGIPASRAGSQQPLTRTQAIDIALGKSVLVTAISADTLAAAAHVRSAREYPNPSVTLSYSKDAPNQHVALDVPLDLPGMRGARVRAAEASRTSSRFGFLAARAAIELNVDTAYTVAQGAALRARLSQATAQDASQLLQNTRARRDAGDASDLDVNVAEVAAGQAANIANADSLAAIDARLDLQSAMGLRADSVSIFVADSLRAPSLATSEVSDSALNEAPTVAAARAAVAAANETLAFQRRSLFGVPSIQFGADAGDPGGPETGLLPTVGISLPMPLFNRNSGAVDAARAEVTRAEAALRIARMQVTAQLARSRRRQFVAQSRIERDRKVLDAATQNVMLAERAVAEGELALSDVMEARRAQRDAQEQFITDLVAANSEAAVIRILTQPELIHER
jgi:cobalt-zinc-cadmium efflux system outer membrane protein